MILDTSALIAVLKQEPGYSVLLHHLETAERLGIGSPTLVEAAIVLKGRWDLDAVSLIETFLAEVGVEVIPFTDEHWREAHAAFERYGKGRHPAALNFGDCLSFAVAHTSRRPLLCTGADFAKTNLAILPT